VGNRARIGHGWTEGPALASDDFGITALRTVLTTLKPSSARRIVQCGRTSRQLEEPICGGEGLLTGW
jgi:hypothetical protein